MTSAESRPTHVETVTNKGNEEEGYPAPMRLLSDSLEAIRHDPDAAAKEIASAVAAAAAAAGVAKEKMSKERIDEVRGSVRCLMTSNCGDS